ncbi:PrsW family intramembrane metalloprotease [Candidatus Uabimicrobium sp. HlEnr_7]|uniref:PrsW family intramembrane metalloprotease n=1 Tax=Candidatus Uabimicrobium helgolandensis TaxID=3095367 RepID=UPI00355885F6
MTKEKMRLLRSKLVRTLQLLNLAKQKNLIDNEEYTKTTKKYRKKILSLPIENKEQAPPYEILEGFAFKIAFVLVAFFAAAYFLPSALELTSKKPSFLFVAFGCPLVYLVIVYLLDKYEPEPKLYVAGAFMWGAISTVIALYLNQFTAGIFTMAISICLAGVTEELAKGIGLFRLSKHPEYHDTLDAIVYGFAVGLGFAAVENLFYYYQFTQATGKANQLLGNVITMVAIRASLCALGHAVFTTIIALVLAKAKQAKGVPDLGDFVKGYILAALVHGSFNYFCITIGNASILVNSIIVITGLYIFWLIIKNNWKEARNDKNYFKNLGIPSDIQ